MPGLSFSLGTWSADSCPVLGSFWGVGALRPPLTGSHHCSALGLGAGGKTDCGRGAAPSQVLSKYRSGKLPKAFKVIPALSNWEQILYVTEPEAWTAAAMYQATRWGTGRRVGAQVGGAHGPWLSGPGTRCLWLALMFLPL